MIEQLQFNHNTFLSFIECALGRTLLSVAMHPDPATPVLATEHPCCRMHQSTDTWLCCSAQPHESIDSIIAYMYLNMVQPIQQIWLSNARVSNRVSILVWGMLGLTDISGWVWKRCQPCIKAVNLNPTVLHNELDSPRYARAVHVGEGTEAAKRS